jgi:hypothetical protein
MPDYVGILKRSISALPDNDPALRQAVYERARSALARQLTGIEPPLSADEIELQHQHLEDAIQEVESELAVEDGASSTPEVPEEPQQEETEASEARAAVETEPPPAAWHAREGREAAEESAQPSVPQEAYQAAPETAAETERPSRVPMIVMLVLLALILAGAGALAYTNWATVESVYADLRGQLFGEEASEGPAETSSDEAPSVAAVEPPAEPRGPGAAVEPKSDDRLPIDGLAEPTDEVPGERDQAARAPLGDDATGTTAPSPAVPDIPAFDRPAPPATTGDSATAGLVAQRAIFYEQGEEGSSGRASQGAIAWERVERPQDTSAITARLDLPEQGATVTLTFTRNSDPALPASHLIEIEVEGEAGLGGPIQRVPALVLKPSEQARGQALAGAAVPVTDRLFWIALSDDPDQVGRNISLLRDGSWFDMPIMFEDGQRALLTFEKGIPGDRVFETVLAEWQDARRTEQR